MKTKDEEGKLAAESARTQADLLKTHISMQHDREKHAMDMTKKAVDIQHTILKGQQDGKEGTSNSA